MATVAVNKRKLCQVYSIILLLLIGASGKKVPDIATAMVDVVRKFCESSQSTSLSLIQIVIFDPSMCDGFSRALQSVSGSKSFWGRQWARFAKRKSDEYFVKFFTKLVMTIITFDGQILNFISHTVS